MYLADDFSLIVLILKIVKFRMLISNLQLLFHAMNITPDEQVSLCIHIDVVIQML